MNPHFVDDQVKEVWSANLIWLQLTGPRGKPDQFYVGRMRSDKQASPVASYTGIHEVGQSRFFGQACSKGLF